MHVRKSAVVGILSVVLGAAASYGQRAIQVVPAGPGGFTPAIGGMMLGGFQDPSNEMASVLPDLTDDQKAKLKDKATAAQQAAADLRAQSQAKMQQLMQTGDMQAVQDQMATMQKENTDLQAKSTQDMESVLTDDQKNAWEGYLLAKMMKQKLQPTAPTQEQQDKIDAIAKDAGKSLVAAVDADAKNKIYGSAFRKVLDEVLTDDQVGKLVSGPAAGPFGITFANGQGIVGGNVRIRMDNNNNGPGNGN